MAAAAGAVAMIPAASLRAARSAKTRARRASGFRPLLTASAASMITPSRAACVQTCATSAASARMASAVIVAGLADRARIGLARSPCQPSNALYTLRSEAWPLSALSRLLRAGALDLFARVLATRVRSGVKRYDGYLLGQVRVPRWDELTSDQRKLLSDTDSDDVDVVAGIYGLDRAAVTGCLADASCDVTPSGGATAA